MKNNLFNAVLSVVLFVVPVVVLSLIFGGYGAIFGAVLLSVFIADRTTTEPETNEPNQE